MRGIRTSAFPATGHFEGGDMVATGLIYERKQIFFDDQVNRCEETETAGSLAGV